VESNLSGPDGVDYELELLKLTTNAWSAVVIVVGFAVAWIAIGPFGRFVLTFAAWLGAWVLVAVMSLALLLLVGSVLRRARLLRSIPDKSKLRAVHRSRSIAIAATVGWLLLVSTLVPPWTM